jgi:hypothetical protein
VSVQAPAKVVWPWVAQVRLAPCSCDWIGNRGRRSPGELAGLAEPRAGDRCTTAGGPALGRIVWVDPGKQRTGTIRGALMSCVLVPREREAARLLLSVGMQATRWAAAGLSAGDLIMARRRLLTLTHLAGRRYRQGAVRIYSVDLVPARVRPPASAAVVLDAVMPCPRDHRHIEHVRMWGAGMGWPLVSCGGRAAAPGGGRKKWLMDNRFEVAVGAGTLMSDSAAAARFPHRWTPEGVTVEADFTGGHLLHLAAAGSAAPSRT